MKVLPEPMKVVKWPLQNYEQRGLSEKHWELVEQNCVSLLMTYCRDISGVKDLSAVCHGVVVKRHCLICMVT